MALRVSSCNLHVTFKCTPLEHWDILGRFGDRGIPGTYQVIILGISNRGGEIWEVQKQRDRRLCLTTPYFMRRQVGIGQIKLSLFVFTGKKDILSFHAGTSFCL
jgi:hypothetical protein